MGEHLLEILVLAGLAAYLIYRFRSVLGRRTGHQGHPTGLGRGQARDEAAGRLGGAEPAPEDNVVPIAGREQPPQPELPPRRSIKAGTPLAAALVEIKVADPNFTEDQFLQGAATAFGMIVEAFARGDRDTLRNLLAPPVFENFRSAIQAREQAGETLETKINAMQQVDINEAKLEDGLAAITVRFVSEQVNVTRDAEGNPVDGETEEPDTVIDLWTFERDTRSEDPTWYLIATDSPD